MFSSTLISILVFASSVACGLSIQPVNLKLTNTITNTILTDFTIGERYQGWGTFGDGWYRNSFLSNTNTRIELIVGDIATNNPVRGMMNDKTKNLSCNDEFCEWIDESRGPSNTIFVEATGGFKIVRDLAAIPTLVYSGTLCAFVDAPNSFYMNPANDNCAVFYAVPKNS